MRFLITLTCQQTDLVIPINYQYPLSAVLYHIIARGDKDYASFLHQKGYGKGFKLFTFSQISCPFKIEGDRLKLLSQDLNFQVAFHLPQAMEPFVKGLFQCERIDIADKKSRTSFTVKSIESLPDPLQSVKELEIANIQVKPISPIVAGLQNEKGNYDFLSPDDARFKESLLYNWRNKIATCFDTQTASQALLMIDIILMKQPPKSRLMAIKADTREETKIRGWINFNLRVIAEKRFVKLLLNTGMGIYNSMGCGCIVKLD
ncbi:CRISPR-associated Cas6 family protein [Pseudobacter ginsenosidimutans]|uniref:CRISPR-associated endoribonuclease n=2 Tax=Pseudobacter ginsenosidimutans TaxID=661488 RepID=A0A4Q7MUK6_9BACT|nr:CRISPR-associated endoribonuclease Cas6 [Pseudobacter ginsenosidimutans]RZS72565.1 CRISPR-associated Cas6 family protein [Pseudobacter ginsenosidimutans]